MRFHRRFPHGAAAAAALVAAGCSGGAGPDGPSSLAVTTTLSAGDSRCPNGGARIDSGLDDGSGGGIAANGVLEPGEVTSTTYSCKEPIFHVGSYEPPAGADGPFRIYARGGDASTVPGSGSIGGNGGQFDAYMDDGSAGGHVKLFRTGLVDASFTVPARPSFDFGDTPLEVPAATTVHVRPVSAPSATTDLGGNALQDGDVVCNGSLLYVWHDATTADIVTGVHVAAGGTLALDHVDGSPNPRSFSIEHAFLNEGTITAGRNAAGSADGLTLHVGSFWSEPGSRIDLSGAAQAAATVGGNGGALYLSADTATGNFGGLVNQGAIDTSGGDGDDAGGAGGSVGGSAGLVKLYGLDGVTNSADLVAEGGDATAADGTGGSSDAYGSGPYILLLSDRGIGTVNSGALFNDGGSSMADTGAGNGGASGGVQLVGPAVTTSGAISASGGSANLTADAGGAGGDVVLQSVQGFTANSSDASASGGAGATPGASGHVVVDGQMI